MAMPGRGGRGSIPRRRRRRIRVREPFDDDEVDDDDEGSTPEHSMGLLIDGLIILVYFVAITAIGLYMGRREESLKDFALGGRRVPWWAVMASIIAAETSAATFLGAPGEGYTKKSFAYVQLVLGLILGRVLVGYVFLRPYYTYNVYTVYDYLGVRFG